MTDVTLPDDLADQVASVTAQELSTFVEAAVRQVLVSKRTRNLERAAHVAPVGGAGVLPDVDLTRWADSLDLQPTSGHPARL
ncbi:MAG: hypothetical protein LBU50_07700 [Cellulomonas sp.]|jgi:hypothetical protein|nr:hypothetical protein [Cellulomonas sp.]